MSTKLNPPSKEILKELFKTNSISYIAKYFSTSNTTVRKWLKSYNIYENRRGNLIDIPKNELEKKYIHESKSIEYLSKYYSVGTGKIYTWLKKYNIDIIDTRGGHNKLNIPSKTELEKLYLVDQKTMVDIGTIFSVSNVTIRKWLKNYSIPIREHSENQLLVMKKWNDNFFNEHGYYPQQKHIEEHERNILNNKKKFTKFLNQLIKNNEGICFEKWNISDYSFSLSTLSNFIERYDLKKLIPIYSGTSSYETEIKDFLEKNNIEYIHKYKKLLNPYELDFYLPKLNMAIEFNGLFWHCMYNNSNKYHIYEKYKICKNLGIELINIFEDEWVNRKEQFQNFLLSKFNKSFEKIYARKCTVKLIDNNTCKQFVNQNHIQELKGTLCFAFGIFYNDELVGIMSFSNHHRQNVSKNCLILQRLCFKYGSTIVGGSSKLLSYAIKYIKEKYTNITEIISWSDNRISEGNVYEKMGFVLQEEYKPDYSYVKINDNEIRRHSKQSKKKSSFPEEFRHMKEEDICKLFNYFKLYDCGKKKWILKIS